MIAARTVHTPVCASCRLRALLVQKQATRSRYCAVIQSKRSLATTTAWQYPRSRPGKLTGGAALPATDSAVRAQTVEEKVIEARRKFADALPEAHLSEEEYKVYERLYGRPVPIEEQDGDERYADSVGTGVLKEAKDGALEEIEYDEDGHQSAKHRRRRKRAQAGIAHHNDMRLATDIEASQYTETMEELEADADESDPTQRTHPLTAANRFGTSPSTLHLPKATFVDPATVLLSGMPPVHLAETARRVFGGVGLPYSTSTPGIGKTMQQRPIALDAYQSSMSDIEGDVYMATLMPGIFASVTSVLAEARKRLGTAWAEAVVRKAVAGELQILDAGGGGAGVLAVREVLRAEWERMHEDNSPGSAMSLAEADGKIGGSSVHPPLGNATVLTGSDALRRRASQLLENTTFIPRLPDYVHTETAKQKGKFHIVIAPHTLWPLREDYLRKTHTQNLWSMLNFDGGLLVLLEKGVARGFELVAGAREMLLDTRISSPESRSQNLGIDNPTEPHVDWEDSTEAEALARLKDKGMIVAPCTNHSGCPMYVQKGIVKGRKDICHFEQRYIRPNFLQSILGARDKNFEDVEFSYLAVMRGRDLRETEQQHEGAAGSATSGTLRQGREATDRAFEGYIDTADGPDETTGKEPHSLALPRAILPPLKRRGHIILDLCTPSGTLERWTVPRSYDKQAFRDARKSRWGDLWALGAKTRVLRNARKSKIEKRSADLDVKAKSRPTKSKNWRANTSVSLDASAGVGVNEYGALVFDSDVATPEGGKMRRGPKIKGIRDKRDRKVSGNGRRKQQFEE